MVHIGWGIGTRGTGDAYHFLTWVVVMWICLFYIIYYAWHLGFVHFSVLNTWFFFLSLFLKIKAKLRFLGKKLHGIFGSVIEYEITEVSSYSLVISIWKRETIKTIPLPVVGSFTLVQPEVILFRLLLLAKAFSSRVSLLSLLQCLPWELEYSSCTNQYVWRMFNTPWSKLWTIGGSQLIYILLFFSLQTDSLKMHFIVSHFILCSQPLGRLLCPIYWLSVFPCYATPSLTPAPQEIIHA